MPPASFEKLSPMALEETVLPSMVEVFNDFWRFSPVTSLDKGKVWRWRQSKSRTLIEFLPPYLRRRGGFARNLAALGVSAQSLHFLNYLISDPIHAAGLYREGILVHIPRPEKFAMHKLIVADRRPRPRPDSLKSPQRSYRCGAELLLAILGKTGHGSPGSLRRRVVARAKMGRAHQPGLETISRAAVNYSKPSHQLNSIKVPKA